jgi:ABC-type branched-subunit amino acid transport system ATPase component
MTQPDLIILDGATEGLAPLIVDRDYRKVLANCDRALVLRGWRLAVSCLAITCRC